MSQRYAKFLQVFVLVYNFITKKVQMFRYQAHTKGYAVHSQDALSAKMILSL